MHILIMLCTKYLKDISAFPSGALNKSWEELTTPSYVRIEPATSPNAIHLYNLSETIKKSWNYAILKIKIYKMESLHKVEELSRTLTHLIQKIQNIHWYDHVN